MSERCSISRCRNVSCLTYLGKEICETHWKQLAEDREELQKRLGVTSTEKEDSQLKCLR